jgi:hypothetical protein
MDATAAAAVLGHGWAWSGTLGGVCLK